MTPSLPTIALIAAIDRNQCIGVDNDLPWKLTDDLKRFKAMTLGKPIIMGRKTWESIGSKALPNRTNIVVSRSSTARDTDGVMFVSSLEQAIAQAAMIKTAEIMVIGGAQIYSQLLPMASRLYITHVDTDVKGDAFFPAWGPEFKLVETDGPHTDAASGLTFTYKTYDKA